MKKVKGTPYLYLRGRTYYYRKAVPIALRDNYKNTSVSGSLETQDHSIAKIRLRKALSELDLKFARLKFPSAQKSISTGSPTLPSERRWLDEMSEHELEAIVQRWAGVKEAENTQQLLRLRLDHEDDRIERLILHQD